MGKRLFIRWFFGGLIIFLILVYGFTFVLYEGKVGVVTRFGAPRAAITEAGLHWKLPWPFEKVTIFDGRQHFYDTSYVETLTRDKKNVILQTYIIWSVTDPLRFLQSTGSRVVAEQHLDSLVTNAKNGVLGKYDLSALVSTEEEEVKIQEIERGIYEDVQELAQNRYGVTIHQVGLKRLGLPEANVEQVLQQMRAERNQYATRYRSEGQRDASKIRNEADVEVAKLRSEGIERAAQIMGETESDVARIFSEAYAKDPEFYLYMRKLASTEKIVGINTILVFRTDQEPFDVFNGDKGGTKKR